MLKTTTQMNIAAVGYYDASAYTGYIKTQKKCIYFNKGNIILVDVYISLTHSHIPSFACIKTTRIHSHLMYNKKHILYRQSSLQPLGSHGIILNFNKKKK